MNRRSFLKAILAAGVAPYVVTSAGVLMPVRKIWTPASPDLDGKFVLMKMPTDEPIITSSGGFSPHWFRWFKAADEALAHEKGWKTVSVTLDDPMRGKIQVAVPFSSAVLEAFPDQSGTIRIPSKR